MGVVKGVNSGSNGERGERGDRGDRGERRALEEYNVRGYVVAEEGRVMLTLST